MNYFEAALKNQTEIIKEYLKFGDVNVTDEHHSSLLHYAARGNAMEVANVLFDNYINPNIINDKGETPIFEAVHHGMIGFVKLLLRYHADINVINMRNESLFFRAIMKGNREILDLLQESQNMNYSLVNSDGENVLFYALKAYNTPLFMDILLRYPELEKQHNCHHVSLLMLAIKLDNEEVFLKLWKDDTNIYECDSEGNSVLFYAARYASYGICQKLLERKPIIEGKNMHGEDIFTLLEMNSHPVSDTFHNYSISYDYLQYKRNYPYHVAIVARNYDLLEYGHPDRKKRDTHGISIEALAGLIQDENINKILY